MDVFSDTDIAQVYTEVMSDVKEKLGSGGTSLMSRGGQMNRFT